MQNITKKYGLEIVPFFWKIAKSKTRTEYTEKLAKLTRGDPLAAGYLRGIDHTLRIIAFFPANRSRYGYLTSNIVEVVNAMLVKDRHLSILDLLSKLWQHVMETQSNRLAKANKELAAGRLLTTFTHKELRRSRQYIGGYEVRQSNDDEAEVFNINTPSYIVNLRTATCTCQHFQENGILCNHAMAFLNKKQQKLESCVPSWFYWKTLVDGYTVNLPPVNLTDLEPLPMAQNLSMMCEPPPLRKTTGRNQTKRRESGKGGGKRLVPEPATDSEIRPRKKAVHTCHECGKPEHNLRTCPDRRR